MSAPDPFALGGRQDGDDLVLSLFRQWVAVCDEANAMDAGATNDEREPYYQRRDEIEDKIIATPGGAVALAIKAYFLVRLSQDGGSWAPRLAALRLDKNECQDIDVSVLRNAAALVPEIGELSAAIIHEDAELIDLDMEVTWGSHGTGWGAALLAWGNRGQISRGAQPDCASRGQNGARRGNQSASRLAVKDPSPSPARPRRRAGFL